MFSAYFTTSYFPVGWGAVGDLPEGSISGGTTLRVSATATWRALASTGGTAAFVVTAAATASISEAGGSASFSISATGTLTYTGEAASDSVLIPAHRLVRPTWGHGTARLRVEAQARPGATIATSGAAHLQVAATGTMTRLFLVSVVEPAAAAPARVVVHQVHPAETPAPKPVTFPAWISGSSQLAVEAAGDLTAIVLEPPEEPYDDTEEIVLALLMLRRAA